MDGIYIYSVYILFQLSTDNRAGPSNLGNVISQILLCKQITPDFNQEELCSITKDSQEMAKLLSDMQEYMPQQETYLGKQSVQKICTIKLKLNEICGWRCAVWSSMDKHCSVCFHLMRKEHIHRQ